jgi:hypothetical protein
MKWSVVTLWSALVAAPLFGQTPAPAPATGVLTVQPKIMVIPFTKEGEDIRTVLEADIGRRIAITKVKEAFDRRGVSTVDFVARLKAANDIGVFTSTSQSDIKEQLIQFSGADIYVQVEVTSSQLQEGTGATVIMGAYEASTGTSLANKVANSGRFYTADVERLIQRAVDSSADDLLSTMQSKFSLMLEEGRSVLVDISLRSGIRTTFDDPVAGQDGTLAELLENWFADNAWRNQYHLQGTTTVRMLLDDVRLPLRDPKNGRNYGASQFGSALAAYCRSLGLTVTRDVKGNTIFLTITGP